MLPCAVLRVFAYLGFHSLIEHFRRGSDLGDDQSFGSRSQSESSGVYLWQLSISTERNNRL